MAKRKEIRNSTAEFLIFQAEDRGQGIEVIYKDESVWCTQKAMATLFDCSTDNVGLHLKNIFASGELKEEATAEKISVVRLEGGRDVNRNIQFYNLDAIISVGYRVNSIREKTKKMRLSDQNKPSKHGFFALFCKKCKDGFRNKLNINALHFCILHFAFLE